MPTPDELRDSGRALWEACNADKLPAPQRSLLLQAARLADRLDRMAELLAGGQDAWLTIVSHAETGEVTLVVDKLLGEARLHAVSYTGMLERLRQMGVFGVATPAPVEPGEPAVKSLVEQLQDAQADREKRAGRAAS